MRLLAGLVGLTKQINIKVKSYQMCSIYYSLKKTNVNTFVKVVISDK